MAHSAMHFGLAIVTGTTAFLPFLLRSQHNKEKTWPIMRNCLLFSYALGIFGLIPSGLIKIGVPYWFCSGWWMNVFFLYPLINDLRSSGGALVGEFLIIGAFFLQYFVILFLLVQIRRRRQLNELEEK